MQSATQPAQCRLGIGGDHGDPCGHPCGMRRQCGWNVAVDCQTVPNTFHPPRPIRSCRSSITLHHQGTGTAPPVMRHENQRSTQPHHDDANTTSSACSPERRPCPKPGAAVSAALCDIADTTASLEPSPIRSVLLSTGPGQLPPAGAPLSGVALPTRRAAEPRTATLEVLDFEVQPTGRPAQPGEREYRPGSVMSFTGVPRF